MNKDKHFGSRSAFALILNIILLLISFVLIFNPADGMEAILLVLGLVMIVYGAIVIISNVRVGTESNTSVVVPIVLLVLGILLIIFRGPTANVVLPLIIGVWAIVWGIVSLMDGMKVRHAGGGTWRPIVFMSLASIALGVIMLIGMAVGGNVIGTLVGVCLLIYAIINIVQWFMTLSARRNSYL